MERLTGASVFQLFQIAAAMAAGGDAGVDPAQGSAAVFFEGELALEGVEDRLVPLPDAGEVAVPGGFVAPVRA